MSQTQFATLQAIHAPARLLSSGGQPVVFMPELSFRAANRDEHMDVLLVPWCHSGYKTRLFFSRAIRERGQNWTEHCLLERTWWAPSWNGIEDTMPWREMLFAHLRAVA